MLITIPHVRSLRACGSLSARIANRGLGINGLVYVAVIVVFMIEMPFFCRSVVMLALGVLIYEFLIRKFNV